MPRVVTSGRLPRVAPVDKDHATRGTYKRTLMPCAICHTAWYLIQSCWRQTVALGRVVPPRVAPSVRGQQRARGGESKERAGLDSVSGVCS